MEFQKAVREKFMLLQRIDQEEANIPWFVLDARKSIDELHAEISSIADDIIARNDASPVKKLWI